MRWEIHFHSGAGRLLLAAAAVVLLGGCAALQPPVDQSPWALQSGKPGASSRWSHQTFPGKTPTRFQYVRKDGRDAMAVQSESSVSMLRYPVRVAPEALGSIRFSWKVPALIEEADLALRDRADSPVRIVLAFEGDRSRWSPRDAAMAELVRAVTGEEMPYATLMYVWCNRREPGMVIASPRTSRIRKMVVESGPSRLGQWLDYERDVRADYERAFGEKPGALVGIGIMTDSDNTRSQARAWYGPLQLVGPAHRAP